MLAAAEMAEDAWSVEEEGGEALLHTTLAGAGADTAAAADPRGVLKMAGCVVAIEEHRGCPPSWCFSRCR